MLIDLRQALRDTPLARFAFNMTSVEGFRVLLEWGESRPGPTIIQCTERYLKDLGEDFVREFVVPRLARSPAPFVLHLDHAGSVETVMRGLRLGFSSVMYDGSTLPFAANVANSREVARLAALAGVSFEAEIGHVGGAEDGEEETEDAGLTTVEEARAFVQAVPVDALAVAVGNAHGRYRHPPHIRLDRVEAIAQAVGVPLVLHGGTGIPLPTMVEAARRGIKKINVGTELKEAWLAGAQAGMARSRELDDVRQEIRAHIRQAVATLEAAMSS